ncbi:hypothetical protein Ahy_A06g030137 [Arachis hypogaea]|uniref:Uncharacterized protein n=1 Tax=Arachis hypogaea TaxID=3818 RepID=A0A445CVC1_ARAHY|nr:hypothetical protein Ahy_A06g030137 [Arachis hypogaea]
MTHKPVQLVFVSQLLAIPTISPEKDFFIVIKVFAVDVILATDFIHVLSDAFENLTSSCLDDHP